MKILVIEDNSERIGWFRMNLEQHDLDICEHAGEGIAAVKAEKYDLIFLDHDLGGRYFVPSEDPDTGFQVAKVLRETVNRDTRVIIHSYNPDGADNMAAAIGENAEKKPFGTFRIEEILE